MERDDRLLYEEVKDATTRFFGLRPGDIEGNRRTRSVSLARSFAFYLAKQSTGLTNREIGELTGDKSGSAVGQGFDRVEGLLATNELLEWTARHQRREQRARDVLAAITDEVIPPTPVSDRPTGNVQGASGSRKGAVMRTRTNVRLGVPGLDSVLPKGIQAGSLVLIVGPPGSGKTLLAMQLLMEMDWWDSATRASPLPEAKDPALFLSADESPDLLRGQRDSLLQSPFARGLQVARLCSYEGMLAQDPDSTPAQQGEALELLLASIQRTFPGIAPTYCAIGLDGVANIPELRGASLAQRREALRQMAVALRDLMHRMASTALAAIMTAELPTGPDEMGVSQLEEYLADVVIRVGMAETSPGKVRRFLEVPKARYVDSVLGRHSLSILSQGEVKRRWAAAATLGWSREAMKDTRRGVVVFPRMRWVPRRGTGPFSSNLEDTLLSLRRHVSAGPREAPAVLRSAEAIRIIRGILQGIELTDLNWETAGKPVLDLFLEATRTGWQWPSEAMLDDICSQRIARLGLGWARQAPPEPFKSLLSSMRRLLRTSRHAARRQAGTEHEASSPGADEEQLDPKTVVKIRNALAFAFNLERWSEGRLNAAAMGFLEILAMVEGRFRRGRSRYCSLGVADIDLMFGANGQGRGVARGSSTAVIGGPGTGKSTLAYCFMLRGLIGQSGETVDEQQRPRPRKQEEDVIFLSFDERHKRVLRDAGSLRIYDPRTDTYSRTFAEMAAMQILEGDLRTAPEYARFRFVYENPVDVDLNRLSRLLTREIESLAPQRAMLGGQKRRRCRLIIDSLSDLERNMRDPIVFNEFVTNLLNCATDWDVTTLVVYEIADPQRQAVPPGRLLSFMADNVILLRHVQRGDTTHKVVSIRKARGRNHSPAAAELVFRAHPKEGFYVQTSHMPAERPPVSSDGRPDAPLTRQG